MINNDSEQDIQQQDDVYFYAKQYTVNNKICKILFPSSIIFLYHHKTGTVLAKKLRHIIMNYCQIIYAKRIHRLYDSFIVWINFRDNPLTIDKLQRNKIQNVKIHFVRDPVLTIISGFKYHMSCKENWASTPLNVNKLKIAAILFDENKDIDQITKCYLNISWTFQFDKEPPIWRSYLNQNQLRAMYAFYNDTKRRKWGSIRMMYLYYLNDIVNQINLKEYGDFYGYNLNYDDIWIQKRFNIFGGNKQQHFNKYRNINEWYSQMFGFEERMKYGLYFEMIRYLFVIYPEIYDYHFNKITDPLNELKMEIWNTHFDENANRILDELNLFDTQQNRNKLIANGLIHINITKQRELLLQEMKKQDASVMVSKKNVMNNSTKYRISNINENKVKQWKRYKEKYRRLGENDINPHHIHQERNNTKYIHALLTIDIHICLLLKYITNLIEYGWHYSLYC